MKTLQNVMKTVSSVYRGVFFQKDGHSRCLEALASPKDDSFEIVGYVDEDPSDPINKESFDDSFEIDLEGEDLAILQYNSTRRYLPCFNYAGLGRTQAELKILEEICSLSNLRDMYSSQSNDLILVLSSRVS